MLFPTWDASPLRAKNSFCDLCISEAKTQAVCSMIVGWTELIGAEGNELHQKVRETLTLEDSGCRQKKTKRQKPQVFWPSSLD